MYDSRKDTLEHITKVGEFLTKLQVKLEERKIEINQKRFGYSDELKSILINTVKQCFD